MESTKLIEIPTYDIQQENVKGRINVGVYLRDKDYRIIAKDVMQKYNITESISDLSPYSSYVKLKYNINTCDKLLEQLNQLIKS